MNSLLLALEQQLENEHEERTLLLREKHELERRLQAAAESERHDRAGDEALLQRLKRDVKRTKALLRDTQAQLERQKAETPGEYQIIIDCKTSYFIQMAMTLCSSFCSPNFHKELAVPPFMFFQKQKQKSHYDVYYKIDFFFLFLQAKP